MESESVEHQEIRLVILHRNSLFRESLALILTQQRAICVVHAAPALSQIDRGFTSYRPDLVLVDFGLPGRGGLDDAMRIRALCPEVKILMIGVPDTETDVLACIEVGGASGYLLQDTSLEALIKNIRAAAMGEAFCSPRIASLVFSRISALARQRSEQRSGKLACLTGRESEIITLIESGLSNKEIASRLSIEVQTVKNHVHNILDKLQLAGRREAAKYARQEGLAAK
jgi:DNA-binding NarL/FixJ family response regulator